MVEEIGRSSQSLNWPFCSGLKLAQCLTLHVQSGIPRVSHPVLLPNTSIREHRLAFALLFQTKQSKAWQAGLPYINPAEG